MRDERTIKAAYLRTIREARVALLRSLVGIAFQEPGHRTWLTIVGVSEDGAIVENADNPGEGTVVVWDRVPGLIRTVAASGLGERTRIGWKRKNGLGDVYDWPHLVDTTGWSYADLDARGISFCMVNRRKGGDESWVTRG